MPPELINKNTVTEGWDTVIEPGSGWFAINLKEVWRYRDLLLLFVRRDFVAQYKQTILGPLWHIIQPLFTTLMFLLVFGKIANIPTDGIEPKLLFFMSGITAWNYFSACLVSTSTTFVANAVIFGKVYFPRLVIPLSAVLSNLIKFFIQFLLLLAFIIFYAAGSGKMYIGYSWLLIPVWIMMLGTLGLGIGIIISSLTTKYRDFAVLTGFAVQLLMYAVPIAYPLSMLKESRFSFLIKWNPLTPIIEAFRFSLFGKGTMDVPMLLYSGGFIAVLVFAGMLIFARVERKFMDTV